MCNVRFKTVGSVIVDSLYFVAHIVLGGGV